jgi:photosystem II stability/assembly factor-like uncharacterized protein
MLRKLLPVAAVVLSIATSVRTAPESRQPQSAPQAAAAQPAGGQPVDRLLNALTFRNIGVFRTAAWVTDIAVPPAPVHDHLYTIYAATRSGGVWKTTNAGTTWTPVTDPAGIAATGALAIAPSDPKVVWVGTGDQANARSSIGGKGVFKSTDAGATWQFMGLPDSQHIARIVIHPTNPEIVYVAAMGHLFSKNEERGVFRTTDGGRTWKKVLYVNDGVGAIDLVINRKTPATLYAAMYDKDRRPWQIVESGPESAIYKSDNGGDAWQRLGGGLPAGKIGRIGLDIYQKNPSVLYALIENQNPAASAGGAGRGGQGVSAISPLATGIIGNELYRTDDGGKTWRKTTDVNVAGGKAPYSFNQIRVSPHDPDTVLVTSDSMYVSRDAGKTWNSNFFRGAFGDFRCMWWDPDDPERIILGSDGGVSVSVDGGRTADYFPNMRVGEVYAVGVDMDDPYNVYGGLQDHDSWKGPSNGPTGRITLENWVTVGPGDGMYNVVDPTDSRWVYNTRELNQLGRMDQKTGIRTNIAPSRPAGQPRLRYNWIAPIALSPHNPRILYAGAQVLFRSLDRGDHWEEISPDLTTNDASKIGLNVPFCTITSISESPITAGVIWVGTDDGKVWVTHNHGGAWTEVTSAIASAGGPADRWVSRVFASPHEPGTAFVAKNGFRYDDFTPYLYKTTDFGRTWTAIQANLPAGAINVVVQDRKNRDLLVAGTDIGVFVSIDGGGAWSKFASNLPTVAVHDLTIHPRENDLVIGTYGRGFWVADISPLQDLPAGAMARPLHLFDIEPKARYGFSTQGMNYHLFGDKYIEVPNEPEGVAINFWSTSAVGAARAVVTDVSGRTVATVTGTAREGFNRLLWNFQMNALAAPPDAGRGGRGGGRGGAAPPAPPGDYLVTLEIGGEKASKVARVRDRIW